MYEKKTGKLFEFAFSSPFILANKSKKEIDFSKKYGMLFGLIFQIVDDFIDETNSFMQIGKTPGKDKKQGKSTLLKIIGKKNIFNFCNNKIDKFLVKHKIEFKKYTNLEKILRFSLERIK